MPKNIDSNQVHLEQRTLDFISSYNDLKGKGKISSNEELAGILGYKSESSITEILGKRQNIPPKKWAKFKEHFSAEISVINVPESLNENKPLMELAIFNLTESNRMLASAITRDAENRKELIDQNKDLVRIVKDKATADVAEQTLQDAQAMQSALLELLGLVGSGKRWKSQEEVHAVYSKLLASAMGLTQQKGIRPSSDKKNILR